MRLTTKFKELVDEKYPSIPRYADLVIFQGVAKDACDDQKGAGDDPKMLTGYEFRMCVRLYEVTKKLVAGKKFLHVSDPGGSHAIVWL